MLFQQFKGKIWAVTMLIYVEKNRWIQISAGQTSVLDCRMLLFFFLSKSLQGGLDFYT